MKVKLSEVKEKMRVALAKKGYEGEQADFIIQMYLGGEIRDHKTHGLAGFSGFVETDFSSLAKPKIIKSSNSTIVFDAMGNTGNVYGKLFADEAIKLAGKEITGTVLIRNMDSWLRPGAIAQYIAEQDYLAIITNDGGGTSIAPPGGYDPTLGTNPIAYGIPVEGGALSVDLALSKKAWGYTRLAAKYGTDLPPDTFYNDSGEITLNPAEAYSVKPAGEYKGYALAVLVEIICRSLLGDTPMVESTDGNTYKGIMNSPKRGAVIIVIDPSKITDLNKFKQANARMFQKIRSGNKLRGQEIRIPGKEAGKLEAKAEQANEIEIPEELWQEISSL